ncbi:MAG TPA: ATP-binding protein [Kofleriaceae bacterium]|jgi:two-component system chemotaxis sensor kinase CheA
MTLHPLARCQLEEAFPDGSPDLPELRALLTRVSAAYAAADADRRDMAMILDNVAQGFATVDLDGGIRKACSQAFTRWFGPPHGDIRIWTLLADHDPNLSAWMQLGFESIHSELMPIDVVLGQLPRRIARGELQFAVEYQPIGEPVRAILVVVSDITDELARQRAEAAHHELLAVVDHAYRDRAGFLAFVRETNDLVHDDPPGIPLVELKHRLHTVKGNAAMFGVTSVSEVCHEIETRIADEYAPPDAASWGVLVDTWQRFHDRVDNVLHISQRRSILVDWEEYQSVVTSIGDSEPSLAAQLQRWGQDATRPHLEHFAERGRQLARRLGKAEIEFEVHDNDLRIDSERFAPLWSVLIHSVRNAIDHGIESTAARLARGKPARARLTLSTEIRGGELIVEIRDDGNGVDWAAVARRAAQMGLPAATRRDLVDALFSSGLSTASEITQTSGRGLGMSAVRATCTELGGRVDLVSEPGTGTTVRCCVPLQRSAPRTLVASLFRA